MIKSFIIAFIKLYQRLSFLKHLLPACREAGCRFYPSCSQYAIQAVDKYGAARGVLMALKRIFRCSPLSAGGYDPLR